MIRAKSSIFRIGLVAVVLSLGVVGAANASTFHYNTTVTGVSTQQVWATQPITVSQFPINPDWGQPIEAQIYLWADSTTILTIENLSMSKPLTTGSAYQTLKISITGAGLGTLSPASFTTTSVAFTSPTLPAWTGSGPFPQATSGPISAGGSVSVPDYMIDITDPTTLALYVGSNVNLNTGTLVNNIATGDSGNAAAADTTTANLNGYVVYTYIPEPASLSLIGLGALALMGRPRRRA